MTSRKPSLSAKIRSLRAEARLMTLVGAILLAIGLPVTLGIVFSTLNPHAGVSPWLALFVGGPLILLGYGACSYAAKRLADAKNLEKVGKALPKKQTSADGAKPRRKRSVT